MLFGFDKEVKTLKPRFQPVMYILLIVKLGKPIEASVIIKFVFAKGWKLLSK
jgi:hypothetical protein